MVFELDCFKVQLKNTLKVIGYFDKFYWKENFFISENSLNLTSPLLSTPIFGNLAFFFSETIPMVLYVVQKKNQYFPLKIFFTDYTDWKDFFAVFREVDWEKWELCLGKMKST